jgi:Prenyltransferase and squalene oxidase repeat
MLRKVSCTVLAFVALVTAGSLLVSAAEPQTQAANDALDYIRTLQNTDGGFPDFGTESKAGATIDVIFAFVAADIDPHTVKKDGNSPLDYLEDQAAAYATTPGHIAKLVLGLAVAEEDPGDFAGQDFLELMETDFDSVRHSYGDGVLDHEIYMLARATLDLSAAQGSVSYLKSKLTAGGCWEFSDGFGCDTNTTALGIQALLAASKSPSDSAIEDALDYLEDAQNDAGGWPYDPLSSWGTDSDANSTAFVLQALVAAGEDVDEDNRWEAASGKTPLEALIAFQLDSGAFEWQPGGGANFMATYQAVPALILEPYPGAPKTEFEEETATPKPTKTPTPAPSATPTLAPTAAATATALPSLIAPPRPPVPVTQVITIAAAGDGAATGEKGFGASVVMTLLLAGGGALAAAAGLRLHLRRQ